eukprot:g2399.t1
MQTGIKTAESYLKKNGLLSPSTSLTCTILPLADGGEGTLSVIKEILDAKTREKKDNSHQDVFKVVHSGSTVCDALLNPYSDKDEHRPFWIYHKNRDNGTSRAFIELAQACGLEHVQKKYLTNHSKLKSTNEEEGTAREQKKIHEQEKTHEEETLSDSTALRASTLGTGMQVREALAYDPSLNEIVMMFGGSATTDGGIGIGHALGYRFLNAEGKDLGMQGGGILNDITSIDGSKVDTRITNGDVQFTLLVDTQVPLQEAALLYSKQKGASQLSTRQRFHEGLLHLHSVVQRDLLHHKEDTSGKDTDDEQNQQLIEETDQAGWGAAGGSAAGVMWWTRKHARIIPGTKFIFELANYQNLLANHDVIITGEGRVDQQSGTGKLLSGIAEQFIQYEKSSQEKTRKSEDGQGKSVDGQGGKKKTTEIVHDDGKVSNKELSLEKTLWVVAGCVDEANEGKNWLLRQRHSFRVEDETTPNSIKNDQTSMEATDAPPSTCSGMGANRVGVIRDIAKSDLDSMKNALGYITKIVQTMVIADIGDKKINRLK